MTSNPDLAFQQALLTRHAGPFEGYELGNRLAGFGDEDFFARAAMSTSLEKFVLALWMLTVSIMCTPRPDCCL